MAEFCVCRCHVLLTLSGASRRSDKRWLMPVLNLFAWPPGLGVDCCRTRIETQTGSAEFLIAVR